MPNFLPDGRLGFGILNWGGTLKQVQGDWIFKKIYQVK